MNNSAIFSERFNILLSERKAMGYTYQTLASYLGAERKVISRWATGLSTPKLNQLFLICNLFKCSSDWLLGLSNDRFSGKIFSKDVKEEVAKRQQKLIDNRKNSAYYFYKSKGICVRCGCADAAENSTTCAACTEKRRSLQKKR